MSIEISSKTIEPIRHTYDNVARRLGSDKPASRYQEATFDIQPEANFHYRPTWAPQFERFDKSRTAIEMEDWYAFKDPRQYYYGSYVMARAKQQDSMEKNYHVAEKRGLTNQLPEYLKQIVNEFLVPLRHVEWGANMNNCYIADFGYGTAVTQVAMYNAMDHLAVAQYLTRLGLMINGNDNEVLDQAKQQWMDAEIWQGVRHTIEDSFVIEDWCETQIAQNVVLDGLLYPLVYEHVVNKLVREGGSAMIMLTEFMMDLYGETVRWTNAFVKTIVAESDSNKQLLSEWAVKWVDRYQKALSPLAEKYIGDVENLDTVVSDLTARLKKQGINL